MRRTGIATKLICSLFLSCAALFGIVLTYNYFFARRIIVRHIEDAARNLSLSTVHEIEAVLRPIEKVPRDMAYAVEHGSYSKEDLIQLLRSAMENNPEIFGSTIAFEPNAFDKSLFEFAPYFYRKGKELKFRYLGGENYRYHEWDWYASPKKLQRPVWTEPYFDEFGGEVIMSTYSVPFYQTVDGKRRFMGIITADVSLDWLRALVDSIRIGKTGFGFLISCKGTLVTHPDSKLIMNSTLFDLARRHNNARLKHIAQQMVEGKSGFAPFDSPTTGHACWLAYQPLPSCAWSLGVLFPQKELMADVRRLNYIVTALIIVAFAHLLAVVVLIARSLTRPLRTLAETTTEIARGNLDFTLPPVRSHDEVGRLAESFGTMRDSLKRYIEDLRTTTAAKERIEGELRVAHDIQMSILPKIFPPFPEHPEVNLFATLEPAREVGGDLYDFFFLDRDHLCFVIGDVSGKGVPASLFMAMTKTLIKTTAKNTQDPATILDSVNRDLARDNEASMFVTLFCGVLDLRNGALQYCNGGHNPPFVLRRTGAVEPMDTINGMVVGASDQAQYSQSQLALQPGDTLYLYTDGLTEAMNDHEQMFTDRRLYDMLTACPHDSVKALVTQTLAEVKAFAHDVAQSDDITILALRYDGPKG